MQSYCKQKMCALDYLKCFIKNMYQQSVSNPAWEINSVCLAHEDDLSALTCCFVCTLFFPTRDY